MSSQWLASNITRLRRTQGCLTDCVAYYFDVHPESVPYFIQPTKGWVRRLKAYFKRKGFKASWRKTGVVPKAGVHLVCGDSLNWKTSTHCVVYRSGKLAYDPNYPSKWKDKRVTHVLEVQPI